MDTCAIQRPLDTLNQPRRRVEAEAVLGIMEHVVNGSVTLVSSTALAFEISRNPHDFRREHGEQTLRMAGESVTIDASVINRAISLNRAGFAPMDAVHVAAVEAAEVDFFCTCDDRILRRAGEVPGLTVKVISPLELIVVLES